MRARIDVPRHTNCLQHYIHGTRPDKFDDPLFRSRATSDTNASRWSLNFISSDNLNGTSRNQGEYHVIKTARNEDDKMDTKIWEAKGFSINTNKLWNAIKAAICRIPAACTRWEYVFSLPLTRLRLSRSKYEKHFVPKKVTRGKNQQRKHRPIYTIAIRSIQTSSSSPYIPIICTLRCAPVYILRHVGDIRSWYRSPFNFASNAARKRSMVNDNCSKSRPLYRMCAVTRRNIIGGEIYIRHMLARLLRHRRSAWVRKKRVAAHGAIMMLSLTTTKR